jgi:elongator complex protein 3
VKAKKSNFISQHRGLGKWLMSEAEKLAKKEKAKKIYVISGVGVRQYYKKLDYFLKDNYMVKSI